MKNFRSFRFSNECQYQEVIRQSNYTIQMSICNPSHLDKKKSSFLFSLSLVFSFFWSCIDLVLLRRLLEIGRLVRRSSSTTRTKLNLLIWQNDRCWSTMWNKASGLRPCHLVLFCVSVCSGSSLKTCKLAWCFMKPHKRCSWSVVINVLFFCHNDDNA